MAGSAKRGQAARMSAKAALTGSVAGANSTSTAAKGRSARASAPPGEVFSDVAYTYDGSLEGLLSAIFAAYEHHEDPADIGAENRLCLRLGQTARFIATDPERARRVERGVVRVCGRGAFNALKSAYLSDADEAPGAIYRFVRHAMAHPTPSPCDHCGKAARCSSTCRRAQAGGILAAVAEPAVEPIFRLARRVANEREKMLQFLRFEHLEGDLWYARCNPSCLVIPTLMGHFCARFSGAPFIIHDVVHEMAGVGGSWDWVLVDLREPHEAKSAGTGSGVPETSVVHGVPTGVVGTGIPGAPASIPETDLAAALPRPLPEEATMQRAWRRFYDAIAVQARYNPELRTSLMPQRFWPYLTELTPAPCDVQWGRSDVQWGRS